MAHEIVQDAQRYPHLNNNIRASHDLGALETLLWILCQTPGLKHDNRPTEDQLQLGTTLNLCKSWRSAGMLSSRSLLPSLCSFAPHIRCSYLHLLLGSFFRSY